MIAMNSPEGAANEGDGAFFRCVLRVLEIVKNADDLLSQ